MSGFDANPFGDPYENNPFADPAVTQVTNQSTRSQPGLDDYNPFANQPTRPPESQGGGNTVPPYPKSNDPPATLKSVPEPPPPYTPVASQQAAINTAELQKRQEELERKAAELQAREEALKNAPYNARAHNWPPLPSFCCAKPCFYQDIAVDIPMEFQKVVRALYYLWIFYACVLCLNLLGALALMIHEGEAVTFGFSILALVLFVPLSFLCWFRPLYKAFRSDSSFNFMVFFFIFFFQTIMCAVYAVGIKGVGSCGFINGIRAATREKSAGNYAVGGIALIIAFLWTMATLMSILLLFKVHRIYRTTGASMVKAQAEFTSGIMSNEHVQTAAGNVAAGAARSAMQQTFSGGNQQGNKF